MRMRVPLAWPVLLAATLLAGCAEGPWPAPPGGAGDGRSAAQEPPLPPAGVRALLIALGRDAPAYALLLQETGDRRMWRTEATSFVIATDGARVVATSGQEEMVMATRIDGPDPLRDAAALVGREAPARRVVDLARADRDPRHMRFGLALDCVMRATPAEADPGLLLLEERCRGPSAIGGFTNRFQVRAADGAVMASEQWIGPGLPALRIGPADGAVPRAPAEPALQAVAAPPQALR